MHDLYLALSDIAACFSKHSIAYLIGGSLSSSVHGTFRATNDVDILVAIEKSSLLAFVQSLKEKFIVNEPVLLENMRSSKAYNIFHEETALKIDLFPAHTEFHRSEISRAISIQLPQMESSLNFASPEDCILSKILWNISAKSERQLADVIGVININKGRLDLEYLKLWSGRLGISAEIARLIEK